MTRIKKAGIILATLVLAAGWAVSPAAGQPFIVTIQSPRGIPLMVVYIGHARVILGVSDDGLTISAANG